MTKLSTANLFHVQYASLLLDLRTRTVRGIRNDFVGLYPYKTCPPGCGGCAKYPHLCSTETETREQGYVNKWDKIWRHILKHHCETTTSLPVDAAGLVQKLSISSRIDIGQSGVRALPLGVAVEPSVHYIWYYFSFLSFFLSVPHTFLPEGVVLGL